MVVPGVMAAAIGGWNVYVAQHAHGMLAGRVVDVSGKPVIGAEVVLFEQQFTNQVAQDRTRTDGGGWFYFHKNQSHIVQLEAHASNGEASRRETIRLWFRAQDRVLKRPLVVAVTKR